ncbi:MAG TPA: sigma-70 family RNA polymerase sigma factor [Candidatus Limnocylindrales bacterium]|nr:sigma-70 family RNA polymerase sigma factor [Candidatus Limnocylindrales bacterium]
MASTDEASISGASTDGVSTAGVTTDAALVAALLDGSEPALERLYDRHSSAVFASAMQTSRDEWLATEVVQETFLTLWDHAERFDPERGELRSWLMTIARNRSIDRLRAAGRRDRAASFSAFARPAEEMHPVDEWLAGTGDLIAVGTAEPLPEVAVTDRETRASIDAAIAGLDPVERRVIVLAYDEGLTQSEIAASLGWPIGTVKTRTRRALRHLREQMTPLVAPAASLGHPSVPCPAPCP